MAWQAWQKEGRPHVWEQANGALWHCEQGPASMTAPEHLLAVQQQQPGDPSAAMPAKRLATPSAAGWAMQLKTAAAVGICALLLLICCLTLLQHTSSRYQAAVLECPLQQPI